MKEESINFLFQIETQHQKSIIYDTTPSHNSKASSMRWFHDSPEKKSGYSGRIEPVKAVE